MRVLFTTPGGLGHIHPTVPLAQAMVARGHDVLWAAPPDGVEHVERAGIRAVAVGTAGLTYPQDMLRRYPEVAALPPADRPDHLFGSSPTHCDVVVSHAGSGTVLATLGHGVPQLCLPQGADQFLNAAAVAATGAGRSLSPGEATAEAVRGAVTRLLSEQSFADAAHRIRASMASMPSPDEVAAILETVP